MSKKVKEIFSDYEARANIIEAEVSNFDVIKKTNTLGITIQSNEYIEIKEIWYFEKFLIERFNFKNIDMVVKYADDVRIKSVEEEWRNIICYMAHKYPLMKPMLLLKSDIEIKDNVINVKMHIKGAEFLKIRKTDIELQKVIKKLLNRDYKIELQEIFQKEDEIKYEQKIKEMEEKAIEQSVSYVFENNEITEDKKEQKQEIQEYNDPDYIPPQDGEIYMPEEIYTENIEEIDLEETEVYLMGKKSRTKENRKKIQDINANDARVTLEGRIISCDCKETKSGKGMIIFELYDGTGLMTCKSFAKDIKEGNEITEKIKEAKAIKIIGKAGLDTYVGDVTVISNVIIATEADIPEMPEEAEEDTPLILGKNINITAPLTKISELSAEDGAVSLDGEIIFMEDRELKSGKTLLSFDLYDGSSTLTCKAFLEKDKAKKIIKRLRRSKRRKNRRKRTDGFIFK